MYNVPRNIMNSSSGPIFLFSFPWPEFTTYHRLNMVNENTKETGGEPVEQALPDIAFEDLPASMAAACERAGWDKLMPVQQKALPFLLNDKDVMVQARTGSGKTGAFVLPLIEKLDPVTYLGYLFFLEYLPVTFGAAYADVLWALLSTSEFATNH